MHHEININNTIKQCTKHDSIFIKASRLFHY